MALLNWGNEYSMGVQSMESRHIMLFGILNDLHEAIVKGRAQSIAGQLLRKLVGYADKHFTAKEV